MPFGVAVAAAGAIAGGIIQSEAASDAADAQAQAAGAASAALQMGEQRSSALADLGYNRQRDYLNNALTQSRGDLQPYSAAGQFALNQLLGGLDTAKSYIAPQSSEQQARLKKNVELYAPMLAKQQRALDEINTKMQGVSDSAPRTTRPGQSENAIWEDIISRFDDIHRGKYGIGMNRSWDADPEAQTQYAALAKQYKDKVKELKDAQLSAQERANSLSTKTQGLTSAYQKSLGQKAAPQGELMRSFTAQDFRNDPTSGGKAPPDLTHNFNMADFQADPGYQFRMDEGNRAVNNSAAAQGGLLSGATLKAIQKYSQNLGSQEYQNAFNRFGTNRQNAANVYQNSYERFNNNNNLKYNRLLGILAPGQNAATNQANYAQNTGANLANAAYNNAALKGDYIMKAASGDAEYKTQAGNALASGIIGQGNAYAGIASSLGNIGSSYAGGYGAQQAANNYNPNYGGGSYSGYGGSGNNAYSSAITPKFYSGNY